MHVYLFIRHRGMAGTGGSITIDSSGNQLPLTQHCGGILCTLTCRLQSWQAAPLVTVLSAHSAGSLTIPPTTAPCRTSGNPLLTHHQGGQEPSTMVEGHGQSRSTVSASPGIEGGATTRGHVVTGMCVRHANSLTWLGTAPTFQLSQSTGTPL
jgi:hypothetical protein